MVTLDNDVTLSENTTEIGTAAVQSLKEEGADIIIALTHQDKEDDRELAASVPGIDLIIGGATIISSGTRWSPPVTAQRQ
ncbi:hypothetical protein [Methanogenium cariaci]|uniref:hypothetical protein n=1 Tax=Methanogenium cariaci TaxID=2197 RepID=UPI001FDEA443|nr:hypothetical protein [Methanogenium cariaci]